MTGSDPVVEPIDKALGITHINGFLKLDHNHATLHAEE